MIGILAFAWPGLTIAVLVGTVRARGRHHQPLHWAEPLADPRAIMECCLAGHVGIVAGVIAGEWMLALSGVLVFAFPAAGAVGIAWLMGVYAAAAGLLLISLGVRLRTRTLLA
jgi:hypothetical protein